MKEIMKAILIALITMLVIIGVSFLTVYIMDMYLPGKE